MLTSRSQAAHEALRMGLELHWSRCPWPARPGSLQPASVPGHGQRVAQGSGFLHPSPPQTSELLLSSWAWRRARLSCQPLARGQTARHGPEHCSVCGSAGSCPLTNPLLRRGDKRAGATHL